MTTVQEKKRELTVGRYEFYKTKDNPMPDKAIMKSYGMDHNQFNKWKKENGLIGKDYGLRGKKPSVEKEPVKKVAIAKEVPLLKENDIEKENKAKKDYEANRKLQEKLAQVKTALVSDKDSVKEKAAPEVIELENELEIQKSEPQEISTKDEGLVAMYKEIEALKSENERLKKLHAASLIVEVNDAVKAERHRQNELYGYQRHSHGDWLMILAEEQGEVAQAMQKEKGWGKETDASNLYEELIHVAAVASAIAEQVLEERSSNGS